MSQETINIGTTPDDGTGDPGRTAFDKVNTNFTELYSLTSDNTTHRGLTNNPHSVTAAQVSALADDGSIDSTGGQLFTGHIAVGATATVGSSYLIHAKESFDTALTDVAVYLNPEKIGTPFVGHGLTAFNGLAEYKEVPQFADTGSVVGLQFAATHNTTSDIASVTGARFTAARATGSGAVTSGFFGLDIVATLNITGNAIAESVGIDIKNFGSADVTTAAGIKVAKQENATNNYGILLNGDNYGSDVVFGAGKDIRQHFNGTNLEFEGAGIARTASTVTHDAYVIIAINGTPYKFMLGS